MDFHFSVLGIPVRVHPMFWLMSVLLCLQATGGEPALVLSWVVAVFVSILVHELGHALTARAQGWEPWITLYALGGLASYQPSRRDPRRQLLITLAGPAAGFLLAALLVGLLYAVGHPVTFTVGGRRGLSWSIENTTRHLRWDFVEDLLFINIWWGLVNLLPVYPLDGGAAVRESLSIARRPDAVPLSLQVSVAAGLLVAVYGALRLHDAFLALCFGYLAFQSFQALQQWRGGYGGGRW